MQLAQTTALKASGHCPQKMLIALEKQFFQLGKYLLAICTLHLYTAIGLNPSPDYQGFFLNQKPKFDSELSVILPIFNQQGTQSN